MQPTTPSPQSPSSSVSAATAAILDDERRVRWVLNALNNKLIQPLRHNVLGAATSASSKTADAEQKRKKELLQKYRFSTAFPATQKTHPNEEKEKEREHHDTDDNFLSPVYVPQLSKGQLQALFAHWDSLLAAHELFLNHLEESFQIHQNHQEGGENGVEQEDGTNGDNDTDPTLVALEALQHPVVTYFLAEHGSYCVNFAKNTAPTLMFLHAAASFMGGLLADVPPTTGIAAPSTLINEFSVLFRSVNKQELEQYVSEAMDHVRFSFAAQDAAFCNNNSTASSKTTLSPTTTTTSKPSSAPSSSWMSKMLHAPEASLFGEHASRLISCTSSPSDNTNDDDTKPINPSSPNCESNNNKLWKTTIRRNNSSNNNGSPPSSSGGGDKRLFDKPQGPFEELLLAMGVVLGSRYRIIEFQRCLTNNIKMQLICTAASSATPATTSSPNQHQQQQQAAYIAVLSTAADLEQRWLETVRVAAKMAARTVSQHHSHTPLLRVIEQTQSPKQKNYLSRTDLLARICPPTTKSTRATSITGHSSLHHGNNNNDNSNTRSSPLKSRLASFWNSSSTSRDASPEATITTAAASHVMEPRMLIREGRVHKRYGRVGGTHPRYLALWDGLLCYFEEVAEEQKTVAPLRTALDSMWKVEAAAHTHPNSGTNTGGGRNIGNNKQQPTDGSQQQQQHVDPAQERRERMQARLQQAGVIYASNSMTATTTSSNTGPVSDPVGMAKRRVGTTRQPPGATTTSTLHQQQQANDKRFAGGGAGGKAGFFGSCCTADALEEGPLRSNTPTTLDDTDSYSHNNATSAYTDLAAATSSKNGSDVALQSALTETGHILLQQALLSHHQAVDHSGYILSRFRNLAASSSNNNSKQVDEDITNNNNAVDGIIAAGDFSSSRFAQRRAKLSRAIQRARAAGNKSSIVMDHNNHYSGHDDVGTVIGGGGGVEDSGTNNNNNTSSKKLSAFNQRVASMNNEGPGVLIRYRLCSMFEPDTFKISIPGVTADFILLSHLHLQVPTDSKMFGSSSPSSTATTPSLRLDEAYRHTITSSTYQPQSEEQERQSRCFELIVPERRYVFFADSFEEKLLWVSDICKMLLDRGNGDKIAFPDDPTFSTYERWVNISKAKASSTTGVATPVTAVMMANENSTYDTLEEFSPTIGTASSSTNKRGFASSSSSSYIPPYTTTAANRLSIAPVVPETELDIMAHKCFPTAPPHPQPSSTASHDNTDVLVINFKSRLAQQTAILGSSATVCPRVSQQQPQHVPTTITTGADYGVGVGNISSAFPSAVLPPRAFTTTTASGHSHPLDTPTTDAKISGPEGPSMTISIASPTLPPKTPLVPMMVSTPGILQRRGSFRNSCRPGSISGVVGGGGGGGTTPRPSHHHNRTFSSNQNSHVAVRTPMSASFVGRSASFVSLPEETFGTPNSATTPLQYPRHAPSKSISGAGTFADERQLFPTVSLSGGGGGGSDAGGPLYSPNENVYDDDNDVDDMEQQQRQHSSSNYNQKLPFPPTHQRRATFDLGRDDDNTTGPLSSGTANHHHPQIHHHHSRQYSIPGSASPTTLPSPTSDYTAVGGDILLMPAHSGSFVDHGTDETMSLVNAQQHINHSYHHQYDNDEDEDAATSNIPFSEIRRRAVLEELAIIDSDSNSSSISHVGGGDNAALDGEFLEY